MMNKRSALTYLFNIDNPVVDEEFTIKSNISAKYAIVTIVSNIK